VTDLQTLLLMALLAVLVIGTLWAVATRFIRVTRETQPNGRVVVRCRDGHVFTTVWVPGLSVKAIRLGLVRYQWCPVGQHRSFVTPVPPGQLTERERHQAAIFDDGGVP
jgi:hypothetical protein